MNDAMMTARLRARAYRDLSLELPTEAARLFAIDTAAQEAITADPLAAVNLDVVTVDNVAERLRDAALTRAVRDGMRGLHADLALTLGRQITRALEADRDRCVKTLRRRFTEAARIVTDAITAGLTADTYADPNKVIQAGPDAAALYHQTRDALAHLTEVRGFIAPRDVTRFITLTDDAHTGTLEAAADVFTGPGGNDRWLRLYATAGIKPALNTTTEAAAVTRNAQTLKAQAADEQRAREEAAAKDREDRWTRMAGGTPSQMVVR